MALRVVTNKLNYEVPTAQQVLLAPGAKFVRATAAAIDPKCVEVHHLADSGDRAPIEFVVGVPGGRIPDGFEYLDTVSVGSDLRHIYREAEGKTEDAVLEPNVITDDTVAPTGLRYSYTIALGGHMSYILKGEAPVIGILSLLEKYTHLGALGQHHFVEQLSRRGYARSTFTEREDEYVLTVRLMA